MKKSSKYNLLSKNESEKQKDQQQWVEMQPISKWQGKAMNSDSSYMKFEEEEYSEVERDNVPLNKGIQKSTNQINQNKNIQSSAINEKRMQYLRNEGSYQQNSNKMPKNQPIVPLKSQVASQKIPNHQQRSFMKPQSRPAQSYLGPVQNPYNNYPTYPQNYAAYQHQSMYLPQQGYRQSQCNNFNQSQIPYNQSYVPQHLAQQFSSQVRQSNINQQQSSIFQSQTRSSTRKGIPQMTVNCDKCTFTQSVPGNSQMYICCMCNEINECFPLYGVFTCGICRANVIYPHGTSRLIKCTKCQTVNRVNPQPSKRVDEVVNMGKQRVEIEQEYIEKVTEQKQQKPSIIMSRNEYDDQEWKDNDFSMKVDQKREQIIINDSKPVEKIGTQEPFKILPASQPKSKNPQQIDFFNQKSTNNGNQPQITQQKQLKRDFTQFNNIQFKQELIDLTETNDNQRNTLNNDKKLHQQLLQLTEKLDESWMISQQHDINMNQQVQQNKKQKVVEYPSIFDD